MKTLSLLLLLTLTGTNVGWGQSPSQIGKDREKNTVTIRGVKKNPKRRNLDAQSLDNVSEQLSYHPSVSISQASSNKVSLTSVRSQSYRAGSIYINGVEFDSPYFGSSAPLPSDLGIF